jgi:HPt (histidine-containing phosphotransfer) domain-containing protein
MTLETYLESAKKKADEIEKYWAEKDVKNTTVKVHALKSSSQAIGALKLSEFAARLEKAGNEGDLEMLDKELGELVFEYRQLAGDLERLNKKS